MIIPNTVYGKIKNVPNHQPERKNCFFAPRNDWKWGDATSDRHVASAINSMGRKAVKRNVSVRCWGHGIVHCHPRGVMPGQIPCAPCVAVFLSLMSCCQSQVASFVQRIGRGVHCFQPEMCRLEMRVVPKNTLQMIGESQLNGF